MKNQNQPGALVVGGEHPGLAIARSLGRRGIPVVVVDDQVSVSKFSRYAQRVVSVNDLLDERKTVDSVLEIGKKMGLDGWVLFPTRDENVAAFSRYRSELVGQFRVTTPEWETVKWAWDKNNSYMLAEKLGIPAPRTWTLESREELAELYPRLPLAIKPAIKENFFYSTGAKAWKAETPAQLDELYDKALRQIKREEIMVQEVIPGDGTRQFSYCAFFRDGQAHSTLVARRCRQHPREFGRAATYVETVECPEVEKLSEKFLREINFRGLVDVEFKQDPRDGQYKLLDVNARAWGFHGIGAAAGIDFPYLLYADATGQCLDEPARSKAGIGWLRLVTDVPTAFTQMAGGHLQVGEYLRSLRNTRIESVYANADPLPLLAEFLLLPYLITRKYIL